MFSAAQEKKKARDGIWKQEARKQQKTASNISKTKEQICKKKDTAKKPWQVREGKNVSYLYWLDNLTSSHRLYLRLNELSEQAGETLDKKQKETVFLQFEKECFNWENLECKCCRRVGLEMKLNGKGHCS